MQNRNQSALETVTNAYYNLRNWYDSLLSSYENLKVKYNEKYIGFSKLRLENDELRKRHDSLKENHKRIRKEYYDYRQSHPWTPDEAIGNYKSRIEMPTQFVGYADILVENPPLEVGKITSTTANTSNWPAQVWHKSGENGWISDEAVHENFSWKLAPESTLTIAYFDQYGNRINMEDEVPADNLLFKRDPEKYIHMHGNVYRKRTQHDTQESWDLAQGGS